MRFLVTGSTGFVGGHLVAALARRGEVVPFAGDVRDAASYAQLPRVDVAYHLAARSMPRASVDDPLGTWDVNLGGTLQLLEWARREDVARVVLVSTGHVYGPAAYSPIDEKHALRPVTPYGGSKLAAEAAVWGHAGSYGIEAVVVRPFNMYGPGQGPGFLVPDILLQLREGARLALGDPRPVRDFTYISDAVDMLERAGTAAAAVGHALNLGSGVGHRVSDVVDTALRVSGSRLRPTYDESRHSRGNVSELVVDAGLASSLLGWKPRVGLEEGLRRTWESLLEAGKNV